MYPRLKSQIGLIKWVISLQWRHNERDCVSNHLRPDCLHNSLFGCRSIKHKPPFNWPLWGESTGGWWFSSQRASNAVNVPIWWRHNVFPEIPLDINDIFKSSFKSNIPQNIFWLWISEYMMTYSFNIISPFKILAMRFQVVRVSWCNHNVLRRKSLLPHSDGYGHIWGIPAPLGLLVCVDKRQAVGWHCFVSCTTITDTLFVILYICLNANSLDAMTGDNFFLPKTYKIGNQILWNMQQFVNILKRV